MKKIIFGLLLSFVAAVVSVEAQNYQEVIYLKNGSVIKGFVVEYRPNESYSIMTSNGSLFVCSYGDIEKITKELGLNRVSANIYNGGYQSAQGLEIDYQGEYIVGFGAGVGLLKFDRIYMHTIQGVMIGDNLSLGLGLGVNILPKLYEEYEYDYNRIRYKSGYYLPIYVNLKGYLPIGRSSLFLSLDIGGSFGVGYLSGISGVLFSPAVGISIANKVNLSLGYDIQKLGDSYYRISANALALKVGCRF